MKISIKNMVCNRCIASVQTIFDQLNIPTTDIILGEVETTTDLSISTAEHLKIALENAGFEILEDGSKKVIERIKNLIIEKISGVDIPEDFKLSEFISQHLYKDYSSLSKLFSQAENTTLEQFYILQKIEKVKELLVYNENTLTEISAMLGYKSVQHLSNQFKKVTGFSPTQFQNLKHKNRVALDKI